jgi:hypothetical protein
MTEKIEVHPGLTPGQHLDELIELISRQPHLHGRALVLAAWTKKAAVVLGDTNATQIAATAWLFGNRQR